jgi:glucose-6-phosphate 1-dehydrogenase
LILILGASGDLAKTKVYPALLELRMANKLPRTTSIYGMARSPLDTKSLQRHLRPSLVSLTAASFAATKAVANMAETGLDAVDDFLNLCSYARCSAYNDASCMAAVVHEFERAHLHCNNNHYNLLFYLALPSHVFASAAYALYTVLPSTNQQWHVRVVLEKPVGRDTASCISLIQQLQQVPLFDVNYMDHYLGKEVVQTLIRLKKQQKQLTDNWNRETVQSVYIRWKETDDVDGRAGYFDDYGIVRDVIQNHLLQLVALVAMDCTLSNTNLAAAKVDVFNCMPPIQDCLAGQYRGYTTENNTSKTVTYAAMTCWINSESWKGVPFVLEAGKALDEHVCEIQLHMRNQQQVVVRLHPDPAIYVAGSQLRVAETTSAYARLLQNVLRGEHENFVSAKELVTSWKVVNHILEPREQPFIYDKGSSGPSNRDDFIKAALQTSCPRLSCL